MLSKMDVGLIRFIFLSTAALVASSPRVIEESAVHYVLDDFDLTV